MLRHIIIGRPNGFRRKTAYKLWDILTMYFDESSENVSSSENHPQNQDTSYQEAPVSENVDLRRMSLHRKVLKLSYRCIERR